MLKHIKMVIGMLLIIGAIAGLIYWELDGRETVLMDQLLVATETIFPGTVVTTQLFTEVGVLEGNRIEGALEPDELDSIVGKVAIQRIIKNDQIVCEYFFEDDFYLKHGESLFKIKPEWIAMISSSLRRGDWVDMYEDRGYTRVGTYQVAFVKDNNEVEVRDVGQGNGYFALDRTDASAIISHIEIISDLSGYKKILDKVQGVSSAALILVQREEGLQ